MANTKQARKRARQMVVRNMHLSAQRSQFRTAIKAVRKLIVAGDKAAAQEAFKKAESVIDSMAHERRCSPQEPSLRFHQGHGLIGTSDPDKKTHLLAGCVFFFVPLPAATQAAPAGST